MSEELLKLRRGSSNRKSSYKESTASKTQLSKMVQLGGFLLPDILPLVNSVTNSLVNPFGEEFKKIRLFSKKKMVESFL